MLFGDCAGSSAAVGPPAFSSDDDAGTAGFALVARSFDPSDKAGIAGVAGFFVGLSAVGLPFAFATDVAGAEVSAGLAGVVLLPASVVGGCAGWDGMGFATFSTRAFTWPGADALWAAPLCVPACVAAAFPWFAPAAALPSR